MKRALTTTPLRPLAPVASACQRLVEGYPAVASLLADVAAAGERRPVAFADLVAAAASRVDAAVVVEQRADDSLVVDSSAADSSVADSSAVDS